MSTCLPVFKGYTVDVRLNEFRKADPKKGLEFIRFDSLEGEELLSGFIQTLDVKSAKDYQMLLSIWE
ncbi:MAG: hypothetical protein H6754_06810 [Candidatus Omnitrophica bacterium]|nr:hypothetical protein [Candidatus Omnitrophota bacterium]